MNPPSIPPPPPPPPPLNIPPSRARLQLAARLAMNKRNAAAAASSANGQDGEGDEGESETFGAPAMQSGEQLRNPFADDEEDDEGGSGSGSDDGDMENGEGGGGWNRGSWWRGVVRRTRRSPRKDEQQRLETERFGDGRDSSEESNGPGEDEDMDDEEFGDFAMPEVDGGRSEKQSEDAVSGIDPSREKILLKPLPVHPSSSKTGASPFGSLWPFSAQAFGIREKKDDKDAPETGRPAEPPTDGGADEKLAAEEAVEIEEGEAVVGEDGRKINRTVEAKRRTSIEDPDDDDVDIGEEIIVGHAGLA